jgi:hypothetical protein
VEEIPDSVTHIWSLFWELSRQRQSIGGMGDIIKPITAKAILAHASLLKLFITPSEARLLMELDNVYLTHIKNGLSKS